MKTSRIWTLLGCVFLFGTVSVSAQQAFSEPVTVRKTKTHKLDKSEVKAQRHTVMSRFDSELASSEEERLQKKQNHLAEMERKLSILDTLDISNRKRKILLRDLKYTPFSNRLHKATLANSKFEDTSDHQDE